MTDIEDLMEKYRAIQFAESKNAYKSTCHFVTIENGNPKPYGTGVFVEIDSNYFMLTASHVTDEIEIYIRTGKNDVLKLGGDFTCNIVANESERKKDKYDIAIIKLEDVTYDKIKDIYDFIPKQQLGINHKDIKSPQYSVVGFPASKSKFNKYKNSIKSIPFIYSTSPEIDSVYRELKYNKLFNLIVQFDKKNVINYVTKEKTVAPDLYGMSGGGLWFVPLPIGKLSNNCIKSLVAIMTDWPTENRNVMIGTRIDFFTEIIRKKYKLDLPKSLKIDLTI